MNQSEFGDTPVSRCRYYRQVCGLPAIIDPPELAASSFGPESSGR